MKLYRTSAGPCIEEAGSTYLIEGTTWDDLIQSDNLHDLCQAAVKAATTKIDLTTRTVLAPIETQEVWAAGVTYYRSRSARIEESKEAGGGDFYDRVYTAERPEIFFKATGRRVIGHLGQVGIRSDARWSVPEPELTLLISATGRITGYTIGNDMSSRDIEGENPLYLPQAKVYDKSCALGPCILVTPTAPPPDTLIEIQILRSAKEEFSGKVPLTELKRELPTLASYLYRDNTFPHGSFLMTGTGIVPPDSFSLQAGDEIHITIAPIGTLINTVA